MIKALLAAGETDAALTQAREAVSLNPDVAVAVLALGEALLAASEKNSGALPAASRMAADPGWIPILRAPAY